ncbi:glycosyltransferase [Mesobacillus maritimus]|uniref:MGDG synthase family glycosyltransferase n=1 Tax=Mesobacillus maritimus TaxID=1643336 RepID=UPI00384C2873
MKKKTKTVLFLPFLQIPSGHHHAANALMEGIHHHCPEIKCEKVDILSYSYGKTESLVSNIYLHWIQTLPSLYNAIYKMSVCKNREKPKQYRLYEVLFLSFMKRLVNEKTPDLIVCTHALPAYMLNYLKREIGLSIPVINVYTDYFIHRFWGIEEIDFHFVASQQMKQFLIKKGVEEERIFITGIPVHSKIRKSCVQPLQNKKNVPTVLIAGGNLGVGAIEELIQKVARLKPPYQLRFIVLCGKNQRLYEKLKSMGETNISPYSYINCMEKMNLLYDRVDAIITKPGGVTISECLFKRKPIFIYNALPGQEKVNLEELLDSGLVYQLDQERIQEQIVTVLQDTQRHRHYQNQVEKFHAQLHGKEPSKIIADLLL